MSKRNCFFMSCILVASYLEGWGDAPTQRQIRQQQLNEQKAIEASFPLNPNQHWYTTETFLYWRPYLDGADYAGRLAIQQNPGSEDLAMKLQVKKPDYEWSPGVRVGIGGYLPHFEYWDINLQGTYYYSGLQDSTHALRNPEAEDLNGSLLSPLWVPYFNVGATKGKVEWRLNFFTGDITVGREIKWASSIVAHPFIGLRTAFIYQKYITKFSDQFPISTTVTQFVKNRFSTDQNFWGVGPRIGSDFTFYFSKQWSFMGTFSSSLLFGSYVSKEKATMFDRGAQSPNYEIFKGTDKDFTTRLNLEGSFGIGWETWVRNDSIRVVPSVIFEASQWLDMNGLYQMGAFPGGTPNVEIRKAYGNLGLIGLNFNLQFDF